MLYYHLRIHHTANVSTSKIQLFTYGQFTYAGFQAINRCCKFSRTSVYSGFSALPLYLYLQCNNMFSFLLFYWVSTFFYCRTTANLPFFLPLIFFLQNRKILASSLSNPPSWCKMWKLLCQHCSRYSHTVAATLWQQLHSTSSPTTLYRLGTELHRRKSLIGFAIAEK